MNKADFEARFGFVPVFDVNKQKRRSIAKHLAEDKRYLEKHNFILIEVPAIPEMSENTNQESAEVVNWDELIGFPNNELPVKTEPKKRGRKPKQK